MRNIKIMVVGTGRAGLADALLLAQNNEVCVVNIEKEKTDLMSMYERMDYVVVNISERLDLQEKSRVDTDLLEEIIERALQINKKCIVVVRNVVPMGFTKKMCRKHKTDRILFSPEFYREKNELYDALNPERIIVGVNMKNANMVMEAEIFAALIKEGAVKEEIEVFIYDIVGTNI